MNKCNSKTLWTLMILSEAMIWFEDVHFWHAQKFYNIGNEGVITAVTRKVHTPSREERRFLYFNHLSKEFQEQMIPHLKDLIQGVYNHFFQTACIGLSFEVYNSVLPQMASKLQAVESGSPKKVPGKGAFYFINHHNSGSFSGLPDLTLNKPCFLVH